MNPVDAMERLEQLHSEMDVCFKDIRRTWWRGVACVTLYFVGAIALILDYDAFGYAIFAPAAVLQFLYHIRSNRLDGVYQKKEQECAHIEGVLVGYVGGLREKSEGVDE